ncbi:TetR/AcrR family transcriptional regulator [Clostridium sp. UBA6640]|uniref:TetR/AcrR family transcriptional regulator n=1 Tax=Clostridium sp. UBA6640 TaxID=1946370 RepID=UPI0025C4AD02|nr:TetR/AcrR family transcriptional regulator [Clostridium sp. UBA6640]
MTNAVSDIEGSIINCAKELFVQRGYEKVDMKLISKKCNISTGTIYNYFSNKSKLFIKILEDNLEKTFLKLQTLIESEDKYKVPSCIKILYEDIEERCILNKELIKADLTDKIQTESNAEIENNIISLIDKIFNDFSKDCTSSMEYNCTIRLAESLLATIYTMIEAHPEEKEKNIEFLNQLILNLGYKKEVS